MEKKFESTDSLKISPGFCCLGVTNKCMLKCRMCCKWKDDVGEEYPTLAHYKKFLSDLRELVDNGFIINFGGGETTSVPS